MDQDLVVRVQQGDKRAFETLTVTDYPRLFRVAHSILRERSHAEDATQQAYFDIWRNIRRLRDPAKFEGWSYRILVNACYAEAKRTPGWLPGTEVATAQEPRAVDAFDAVLDREELEHGFQRLTVDQRVVVVLHFHLDMTLEQVAGTLGIPKGTVESRLGRALKSMRIALRAETHPAATGARQEVVR
jgi:RNA polymerase sigma-70 factor (ECF subfamily)